MKGIRKPDPVLNFSSCPGTLMVMVQKVYHSQEFLVVSRPRPTSYPRDISRASAHVGQLEG